MSHWRVERHYGFGAAQLPIQPESHRAVPVGLVEGMGILIGELTEGGVIATLRRAAGEASAILLSLVILAAVVETLMRDYSEVSPIEVVLLRTVVAEPEPSRPMPVEITKIEPPERVTPKLESLPPPPESPIAKPTPRPKPVIVEIARVEVPKPSPVAKPARVVRQRPQPLARPRVAIDAVQLEPTFSTPTPTPIPRIDRVARRPAERANPARLAPRLAAPAAPAFASPRETLRRRAFRVDSAKPSSASSLRVQGMLAPAPRPIETAQNRAVPPRSVRRPVARPVASRTADAPALDFSSLPPPASMEPRAPLATPKRAARLAQAIPLPRAPRPTAPVAQTRQLPVSATPTLPPPASRADRSAPESLRGRRSDRSAVAGVPLGQLASCLSDRKEDRLKQAVVAAVTTQAECVSNKGTYRFIETKNLNAFLMWIDRAPARPASDRCVELGYALECLQSARRRAAR